MSKVLLPIVLALALFSGCQNPEQEYVSPDRDKIRSQFAPTEHLPAPMPTDETLPEHTQVTPMLPFE